MDESEQMTISELAARVDVTPRTIRFYVAEGLLPPGVGTGRQRIYGYEHYVRLRLIKLLQDEDLPLRRIRAKLEGLSLSEIRDLAELGHEIRQRESHGRAVRPRDLLASVLSEGSPPPQSPPFRLRSGRPMMLRNVVMDQIAATPPEPSVGLWRKVPIAPGIELLYEVTEDQKRMRKIQKIIQDAVRTLSNGPDSG